MKFGLRDTESSDSSQYSEEEEEEELPRVPLQPPVKKSTTTTPHHRRSSSSNNYEPTPVKLLVQQQTKKPPHSRRLISIQDQDSSEDDDQEDGVMEEEDRDGDSDYDSEEEEWPVGPKGSFGLRGKTTTTTRMRGTSNPTSFGGSKLFGGVDSWDQWDGASKQQSWVNANRTFRLSLARSMSTSPLPRTATTSSPQSQKDDLSSIDTLLSKLALQQSQETQQLVSEFSRRNTLLWESIESSIRQAEREEGEKVRILEENRKRMEELERKAREMREVEEKRVEEARRKEEEEKERERMEREKERERVEEEKRKMEEREKEEGKKASALGLGVGEESPKGQFEKWTNKMNHIKQKVLPIVSQNPTLRKSCFQAKRSITPKIGQLTSSSSAISRIITQLDELLSSIRPATPESASEPYVWTLNHLSKSLIKQAEEEVTAKLGTAYPLGRVVVGLLLRGHTELGEVLMARLVKKCFWITGYWPSKQPGQSEESYQKTLGHAPSTSSESSVQYAERMSGLIALYASIVQSSPQEPPQGPGPSVEHLKNVPAWFRPSAGWKWLNLILKPPLLSLEPTPLLLTTFLDIAGKTLLEVYGRQFQKYLELVLREGIRSSEGKARFCEKAKSSRVRLELWLEEWEKSGGVEIKEVSGRQCDP